MDDIVLFEKKRSHGPKPTLTRFQHVVIKKLLKRRIIAPIEMEAFVLMCQVCDHSGSFDTTCQIQIKKQVYIHDRMKHIQKYNPFPIVWNPHFVEHTCHRQINHVSTSS